LYTLLLSSLALLINIQHTHSCTHRINLLDWTSLSLLLDKHGHIFLSRTPPRHREHFYMLSSILPKNESLFEKEYSYSSTSSFVGFCDIGLPSAKNLPWALPKPQVILVHTLREKKTCGEMENTGCVGQPSFFGLVLNYLTHANPDG